MKYIRTFENLVDAKKYEDEIEEKGLDFDILKRLDPTKNFKYLPMICRYALDDVELDDIKRYIKAFDLLISKDKIKNKDIYSYKTFGSLKDVIDVIDIKSKGDIIGEIKKEREIILDNDDFLVFIPLSHRASVKYGMGTKWCISSKNDSFFWYALSNANVLFYFVIVKNKEISDRLFDKFRFNLEDSSFGAQGYINDMSNFEKFTVMVFGKGFLGKNSRQIWTKSNHLLIPANNDKFFKELGLKKDFFQNDLPKKDLYI